jgi:biopolymer transport protein ExbB/TolQ
MGRGVFQILRSLLRGSLFFVFIVSMAPVLSFGAQNKESKFKEAELASLRQTLDLTRDSLQNDITRRWRSKQQFVEQREADKEDLARLKELQERAFAEESRIKEESFSKEKMVEEEQGATLSKQEEWRAVASSIEETLGKESQTITEGFPLDCENRRQDLEALRHRFQKRQDAVAALNDLVGYKSKYLRMGNDLQMVKQTVLPGDGKPRLLTIARFGNVFGFGIAENGEVFFIRQSGKLGNDRYRIDKIDDPKVCIALRERFPGWAASGIIAGIVPTDVLQNDQTKSLITGKKTGRYQQFMASIKAGGAVMAPLLLLPVWALVLIILKIIQFGTRKSLYVKQYKKVIGFIEKKETSHALEYVQKSKGAMARIFEYCLSHPQAPRGVIEKSIKEILIDEIPRLSRYLNTLAVIAGAAPLLGLLGTISGMINLFGAVTHYGTGDPKFLAGGISEALITAKTGLAVAIPVLFIHDYLRNKKDQLQADIEKYSFRILNKLWPEG